MQKSNNNFPKFIGFLVIKNIFIHVQFFLLNTKTLRAPRFTNGINWKAGKMVGEFCHYLLIYSFNKFIIRF